MRHVMKLHTDGRDFMEQFDGLGTSMVFGWNPSQPNLNYDDDGDVAVAW